MMAKKFVKMEKDEFEIKEFVKKSLGKGKISDISIERTPVGEKVTVYTCKPGLIIGRKGEKIAELTEVLKKEFKLENPHIDISEIKNPELDAQAAADEIAMLLEKFGQLKFKIIAYKALQKLINAGALGIEIRLSGKLPSERAKSWRFSFGLMKKVGDTAKIVKKAQTTAQTPLGVIGVKVFILPPDVEIHDRIEINKEKIEQFLIEEIKEPLEQNQGSVTSIKKKTEKKPRVQKKESKTENKVKIKKIKKMGKEKNGDN